MKYKYNSWPLGKLPPELRRPEPEMLKQKGYQWDDPRDIVDMFEAKVAKYFGAKYAVAVDCCSHGIFLSLQYLKYLGINNLEITIPKQTYISVPIQVLYAGSRVRFQDIKWKGFYQLKPTNIIDAAVIWQRNIYFPGTLMCLSFQIKKAVPIGKGGMILTDNIKAYEWLRLARYDGRDLLTPYDSKNHLKIFGWHYYMTPEDAARGILLMDQTSEIGAYLGYENYPDVSQMIENI